MRHFKLLWIPRNKLLHFDGETPKQAVIVFFGMVHKVTANPKQTQRKGVLASFLDQLVQIPWISGTFHGSICFALSLEIITLSAPLIFSGSSVSSAFASQALQGVQLQTAQFPRSCINYPLLFIYWCWIIGLSDTLCDLKGNKQLKSLICLIALYFQNYLKI